MAHVVLFVRFSAVAGIGVYRAGLAVLVKEGFNLDPFSTCLYVFCNSKRDKLKILKWDHNGFWLYYRRLEKGRFQWPDGKKQAKKT